MIIEENVSLKPYNTFGIDCRAAYFCTFDSIEALSEILQEFKNSNLPRLILGGGSNILLTDDYDGIVLKNNIPGKTLVGEDGTKRHVQVGAGENWHSFVLWSIQEGFGGLENLSLIPGNVGASPMQNIGAYGVEIKDRFVELTAVEISTGITRHFSPEECAFGYRESVFKKALRDKYIITHVTYSLSTQHSYNTSYGAIEEELKNMGVEQLTPKAISDAVINIRNSKLPDPKKLGNSGSFFKNPVVDRVTRDRLKGEFPELPVYDIGNEMFKLAAGWLIENAGWKGKTTGNCGVHAKQALVLVNYGGASGEEIFKLSEDILNSVQDRFGVTLEREVNII